MHLLYLCARYPVISETFISDQVKGLAAAGHSVTVLALAKADALPAPDNVRVITLHSHMLGGKDALKAAITLLPHLLLRPQLWPDLLTALKTPAQLAHAFMFAAYLQKNPTQADALICHFGPVGITGHLLRRWGLLRMPQITVFHGFDLSSFLKSKGQGVYKPIFGKGHTSVTIATHWQRKLRELGDASPLYVPLGINPQAFPYQPRTLPQNRPVNLLTVGRLTPKKGQAVTLQALANLTDINWHYHLVGDGETRTQLEALTQQLKLSNRVTFHGSQPHARVKQLFQQADVFLLASQTAENGDMEGLPVVLMEALASGIPTLSTRHSGIPDLIIDGQTGLLIEEGDTAALSDKLRHLLTDATLWPHLTIQGHARVQQQFNGDTNLRRFAEVVATIH